MFLRKVDGPRSVRLPDGTLLTRADLPPVTTVRWVASRKARVARAVIFGLITAEEAMESYGLSEEELSAWQSLVSDHGVAGLRATVRVDDA